MDDAERILGQLREDPWTPFPDAVDLLTRLPPAGAPALRAALTDPNARLRAMAARALGAFCGPETVAALVYVLQHDLAADVRRVAVAALAECGGETAVRALFTFYQQETDLYGRIGAAHALAALRAAPALGPLSDLLASDEPNPWLLGETALALGELGDPAAFDALADALEHPNADVRGKAATALGLLGDPRGIPVLQDTLGNPTETAYVKSLAAEALAQLSSAR
jgi:HEAT repeat protein